MVENVTSLPTMDALLERIAQLERKSAELQAQLDDLGGAFKQSLKDTTDRVKSINQCLGDIYDFLWPLVFKVFPSYAVAKQQSDAILKANSGGETERRR
jgi:hypothetical protein